MKRWFGRDGVEIVSSDDSLRSISVSSAQSEQMSKQLEEAPSAEGDLPTLVTLTVPSETVNPLFVARQSVSGTCTHAPVCMQSSGVAVGWTVISDGRSQQQNLRCGGKCETRGRDDDEGVVLMYSGR